MSSNSGPELQNINNIYLSEGKNKNAWKLFYKDINNDSYINKIIFLLASNMKENPKNGLTIDIIDFIIDFGNQNIINLVSQKHFLELFVNLLKSDAKAGVENQKKVIYLTQKWAKKFYGNKNLSIFFDSYNYLKNNGIVFPPQNYVINTYDKFVNKNDIFNQNANENSNQDGDENDFSLFSKNNQNNQNEINNQNNNFNNNYNNNKIIIIIITTIIIIIKEIIAIIKIIIIIIEIIILIITTIIIKIITIIIIITKKRKK